MLWKKELAATIWNISEIQLKFDYFLRIYKETLKKLPKEIFLKKFRPWPLNGCIYKPSVFYFLKFSIKIENFFDEVNFKCFCNYMLR